MCMTLFARYLPLQEKNIYNEYMSITHIWRESDEEIRRRKKKELKARKQQLYNNLEEQDKCCHGMLNTI